MPLIGTTSFHLIKSPKILQHSSPNEDAANTVNYLSRIQLQEMLKHTDLIKPLVHCQERQGLYMIFYIIIQLNRHSSTEPRVYLGIPFTCVTVNLDQCPPPPHTHTHTSYGGLRGQKFLILITLDRQKRHFWEKNYIKNYFYLLKSTKSIKTTSQKC